MINSLLFTLILSLSTFSYTNNCGLDDGIYKANVSYYNPETAYSTRYTLDVEVEDCYVIKIKFPQGGWLDKDHITPDELDSDKTVRIKGERGRIYDIEIED
jgi:hypothetical protein